MTLAQLLSILARYIEDGIDPETPITLLVGDAQGDVDVVWTPVYRGRRPRIYIQDEGPGFGDPPPEDRSSHDRPGRHVEED